MDTQIRRIKRIRTFPLSRYSISEITNSLTLLNTEAMFAENNVVVRTTIQAEIDASLTFTDRDSYLAWVADWKKRYAQLSTQIRAMRKDGDHCYARGYKPEANALLWIRKAAKVKAGQQRAANLAAQ